MARENVVGIATKADEGKDKTLVMLGFRIV